jgi:hypothetical protein
MNIGTLLALCVRLLRAPSGWDGANFTFSPPLNADEQSLYSDLRVAAQLGFGTITAADLAALRPDVATVLVFMNTASPTAAQAVGALQAFLRVWVYARGLPQG